MVFPAESREKLHEYASEKRKTELIRAFPGKYL